MTINQFAIIESTLREGEQFVGANFSSEDKVEIAEALAEFGVEYIELTSPIASPQSRRDCHQLSRLRLPTKFLTHIRCNLEDAKVALETGVDGINVVMGTSSFLRQYSHGKEINRVIELAIEVLTFIHQQNPQIELRFSPEDSFRSSINDLLKVYLAIEALGFVRRLGVADTVGISTPPQVFELVKTIRQVSTTDIEFHCHNDTGCAIANSYCALEAGATHIDTTVLGIGERNGITPLAGLIARLYVCNPELVQRQYNLPALTRLHKLVAAKVGVEIPFNHCIVGDHAFTHKAGIHTKAILNHPTSYEIINPRDFGLTRSLSVNHRLTGWHAVAERAHQLGLELDQAQIQAVTQKIKAQSDDGPLTLEEMDEILCSPIQLH